MTDRPQTDPDPDRLAAAETLRLFGHDIRSAMSDVIGGLRLIDRTRLTPEAQMQIDRVQAAADMLAGLFDGALMAAAGEGSPAYAPDCVTLADWMAAQNGRWSGHATASGGRFRLDPGPSLPERLRIAPLTLDRIVGNLVSNALRHAAGATVSLSLSHDPQRGLRIAVVDDGPGFPQTVLDRMAAEPDPLRGQALGDTGLGLRIAMDLTRARGGSLSLANRDPHGAEVVLWLPEAMVLRGALQTAIGTSPAPDLTGLSVLVAEDNLTNQSVVRRLFQDMNGAVVFASDGIEALDLLERGSFDIALIDIEMPGLSGLQVMQAIRARDDAIARMPLVALTAYVLRDNREAIYAAGADGIISKPIVSAFDFGRAILRYAGRPAGLPEPEDLLKTGSRSADLGMAMDEERFDALLTAAGPERVELLQRLYADLGRLAGALGRAVADRDIPEIRGQTHILIAISGAVGADRLHRLAEVLNIAAKRRRNADLAALYAPCHADLERLIAFVALRAARLGVALPHP